MNASSYTGLFINDIYSIRVKFATSTLDMHICIDATSDLGLVQFEHNLLRLNTPVTVKKQSTTEENFIDLHAFSLDSFQRLNFELNDEQMNSAPFKLSLHEIPNKPASTRLEYNKLEVYANKIEQLQYEIDTFVYDPNMLDSKKATQAFKTLQQLAFKNNKFTRSVCKVLLNKNVETIVSDLSQSVVDFEKANLFKFRVRSDSLVKNSVIGYLPNVHDIEMSQSLTFDRLKSPAESFYYELKEESSCFRLNKFDGVLNWLAESEEAVSANGTCFGRAEEPAKLAVLIRSVNDKSVVIEYGHIWVYNVVDVKSTDEIGFLEINSNSVNLVYENKGKNRLTLFLLIGKIN